MTVARVVVVVIMKPLGCSGRLAGRSRRESAAEETDRMN
jgi:hypothetical protein